MKNRKFWNWINQTDEEASAGRVLELYGTIAEESWFDDDITPEAFRKELFAGGGPITIWINSPGGDCIAASQIYTMLMNYKDDVTVKIDGVAASAASVIAMAGTQVLIAPTALIMIHNPQAMAFGDHADMEKAIDMLTEVKESIINAYEIKTGLPRKQLSRMMDDETWMNAKKALELGFADGMLKDEKHDFVAAEQSIVFAASAVDRALVAKLAAKRQTTNPKPDGRSIEELKRRLDTIQHYI